MRHLAVVVVSVLLAGTAAAAEVPSCEVPEHLVDAEYPTATVATALAKGQLKIVVIGSSSSSTSNTAIGFKTYPARLEEDLATRLPGVDVKVVSFAKARETAADAEKMLEQVIAQEKPALVVWQTGTVDAMRGVDLEDFRIALSDGIETLKEAKVDVVLMNMQYSPRTESMIALSAYADTMRVVALQHEISLFDRFAAMKHWSENGIFDLYAATKKTDVAEGVHRCLGHLLGGMVVEGAKMAPKPGKDVN